MSNMEKLLTALINGESLNDFAPTSRIEQILICCLNKTGVESCEPSQSTIEVLLQELATNIEQGGEAGIPIEVSTAEEMNELLTVDNIGNVYRFIGTTDSTYTNGDLYEVTEGGE